MERVSRRRAKAVVGAVLGLVLATAQAAVLENANLAIEIDDAMYAVRSIAIDSGTDVQSVDYPTLRRKLETGGQAVELEK